MNRLIGIGLAVCGLWMVDGGRWTISSAWAAATVSGSVQFDGEAPQAEKIKMAADPVCQQQHTEPVFGEKVIVNDNGTLRNVVVYVKEGLTGAVPPASSVPAVLDQHGCRYEPHVTIVRVGQPLEIRNSDPTLHNVNVKPSKKENAAFNLAQPRQGMKNVKTFAAPELMIPFKCNVHPWMGAYLCVMEHPYYAVTGSDGGFTLKDLPAGQYVIEAVHERYGAQTQTVTVADGETKTVEFTFAAQ